MRSRFGRHALLALGTSLLVAAAVTGAVLLPHDPGALRDVVADAGPWAAVGFLVVWIAGTCAFVPANLLAVAGGVLLGPLGVLVSLVGSPLGALAAFGLARLALKLHRSDHTPGEHLRRLPVRLHGAVERVERAGARGVALVRVAPGSPAAAFNYPAALPALRPTAFGVGTALGTAPRVVLYGALGGAAAAISPLLIPAGGLAIGAVALATALVVRRLRAPTI